MTAVDLINARIVTPRGVAERGTLSVVAGRIASIGSDAPVETGRTLLDLDGGWLMPGFIDTQVNGGGGMMFNDAPTVETIAAIAAAHANHGTTGFLPTLISDDLSVIDAGMRAVEGAIEAGVPGVLGIHIEGPFINVTRKGIHNPDKFRRLDVASLALLTSLRRGRTLVTLAPELCSVEDIRALVATGVIVAAGHTEATYAQVRVALDAGMTGFTHLFNAMSPLRHREPGAVGAALDDQASWCGLIIDGHHVDPVVLRIAMRAKRADRLMLVSDAMSTVGSDRKTFMLDGREIVVRDGVCVGPDGTLAGSDLDMATALRNAMRMTGASIADASIMASLAPAGFLGMAAERGSLSVGSWADLVWLDRDFKVKGVWIAGTRVDTPDAMT